MPTRRPSNTTSALEGPLEGAGRGGGGAGGVEGSEEAELGLTGVESDPQASKRQVLTGNAASVVPL